ncbi:MAG: NAD-dependent dehydratase [Ottowia sp.]|nr:NAD-dependent dehydratase [Ottowia sp.]
MIVGNGLIATAFRGHDFENSPNIVIYASGVSNSKEVRNEAFLREKAMLVDAVASEKFICYFSTCSINDPEMQGAPYVVHKKQMEALVGSAKNYAIFRLPQVVGKTPNPHTLTNYIHNKIMRGERFHVWKHARRNLIDVDDVALIVSYLMHGGCVDKKTINVASPFFISIAALVGVFELVLGKKGHYNLVDAGGAYPIDIGLTSSVASQAGVKFDDQYIENLIRKYYGN